MIEQEQQDDFYFADESSIDECPITIEDKWMIEETGEWMKEEELRYWGTILEEMTREFPDVKYQ